MITTRLIRWVGLAAVFIGAVIGVRAEVPLNLSTAKTAVLRYVDSGAYDRDLEASGEKAVAWIEERVAVRKEGENLALILDIDETALSNLRHMREMDFGYLPKLWDEWVEEGTAPALEPVKRIYDTARRLGVTVFFITGRKESDRPGSEKNLRAAGFGDYEQLICKPRAYPGTSGDYKTAARRGLTEEGWVIIANVGDQQSDLAGGYAEKTFKLVNPFYLID